MDDFDKLLSTMVAVGKAQKSKKRTRVKKLPSGDTIEVTVAHNPWTDEALVLIATNMICDNCGNESMTWGQSLYIERKNTRRRNPILSLERLEACHFSSIYGSLPKRVEVLVKHSCTCPLCFGIGDNRADELTGKITPVQTVITFKEK